VLQIRRLYGRLMCVTLVGLCISPWLWILVDGSHALPSDLAVIVFVAIDFTTQCLFGMMLLRNAPALADWGDEPEGTRELQGAERLSEEL
jgi:bacteriorhodopsin